MIQCALIVIYSCKMLQILYTWLTTKGKINHKNPQQSDGGNEKKKEQIKKKNKKKKKKKKGHKSIGTAETADPVLEFS